MNRANEGGIWKIYAMFITRWRHASPFPLIALYLYTKIKHFSTAPCIHATHIRLCICLVVTTASQHHSTALCAALLCSVVICETKHTNSIVCRACDRDRFEISHTLAQAKWGSANRMQHSFVSVCLMLFTHLDIVLFSVRRVHSAPSEFIQRK